MNEPVVPLGPTEAYEAKVTGTTYGFGKKIVGVTRMDERGGHFGTLWWFAFGLPVLPRFRLRFAYGETNSEVSGRRITMRTEYLVQGKTKLKPVEVIKTLLYRWLLAPGFFAVPLFVYFMYIDAIVDDWGIIAIALPIAWVIGVPVGIQLLHLQYLAGKLFGGKRAT
jgi:hypothetical protein